MDPFNRHRDAGLIVVRTTDNRSFVQVTQIWQQTRTSRDSSSD
jgi:hypothetical protein